MIPRINFKWSFIYQEEIHLPKSVKYDRDKTEREVNDFIKGLSKEWKRIDSNILLYMEELTTLKWNKNEIDCYVMKISKFGPISDPLTIPIQLKHKKQIFSLDLNRFMDMMIHELIHNLFTQNGDKLEGYFNYLIKKKYKNLSWNTAIHIPVHAIHKEIFLKFFDEERLKTEINACSYYKEYKKAWDIVTKEGSQKIIKELRRLVISHN
jgi:hypothetical protein